jgi:hypothetical protein
MSFPRHPEIFPSDGGASPAANAPAHRLDEFPAGYSSPGWSPPEPDSASPAGHQYAVMSSCRSTKIHRTANCVLTVCVSRGDKRKPHWRILRRGKLECGNSYGWRHRKPEHKHDQRRVAGHPHTHCGAYRDTRRLSSVDTSEQRTDYTLQRGSSAGDDLSLVVRNRYSRGYSRSHNRRNRDSYFSAVGQLANRRMLPSRGRYRHSWNCPGSGRHTIQADIANCRDGTSSYRHANV